MTSGGTIEVVVLNIPAWLEKPAVFLLLLYRRLRYGCAFRRIPLTKGKFAIVDPEDYNRLNKFKWRISSARLTYYAQRAQKVNGKWTSVMMHRQVIDVPDDMVVDHINHNGLDNRKANLRPATPAQNCWNTRFKKGAGRFRGVVWNKKRKKWRVQISRGNKNIYTRFFDDEIEAAKAYDQAAKKYHGEFAVLNFNDV